MAKRWLGCDNSAEVLDDVSPIRYPFLPTGAVHPTAVTGGTAPYEFGWKWHTADGGTWVDCCETRTGDKWWLYFTMEVNTFQGAGNNYTIWYSKYLSVGSPANGHLRISTLQTANLIAFVLEEYNGGAWGVIATGTTTYGGSTKLACIWEINVTGKTTTITVNGSTDAALNAVATTNTPVVSGTPALFVTLVAGKGGSVDEFTIWEWAVQDGATADSPETYTTSNSNVHFYQNVPISDVAGGVWSANNPDPNCTTQLWKCVDDCEDAADRTDDYIYVSSTGAGNNLDQQFEINNQDAGATVVGVGIDISPDDNIGGGLVEKILVYIDDASESVLGVYTPKSTGIGGHSYKFLLKTPNNQDWTLDLFNKTRVGVRESRAVGNTPRVGMINVQTIGTAQTRLGGASQATACAAATVGKLLAILGVG